MKQTIMGRFNSIEEMNKKLQGMIMEYEGTHVEVKHDRFPENEVVINGVECTFCGYKEHQDMIHSYEDVDMCDSCYEGMVS